MSKFWQKKYISKYSGAEIDAAVEAASGLPAIPENSQYKFITVDGDDYKLNAVGLHIDEPMDNEESDYYSLRYSHEGLTPAHYSVTPEPFYKDIEAPEALNTKIDTAFTSMAVALMGDLKYHKTTISGSSSDADFEDIYDFISGIKSTSTICKVTISSFGIVFVESMTTGNVIAPRLHNYVDVLGMGLGEVLGVFTTPTETTYSIDLYARRCDLAT